ncbi:hypothetical protein F5Y04DRAFT_254298 [Hypomontagnella monticulosa]|nr:hypothetical protein F5Y04DRAFT_254298 [Hypomontagnella monticulosa]
MRRLYDASPRFTLGDRDIKNTYYFPDLVLFPGSCFYALSHGLTSPDSAMFSYVLHYSTPLASICGVAHWEKIITRHPHKTNYMPRNGY